MRRTAVVLGVVALLQVAVAVVIVVRHGGERRPPNVLIIVTDDQRVDSLEVMRSTTELFGDGGVRFDEAVASTPLCCPARASIFSGRYSHNHGVVTNLASDIARLDHSSTIMRRLGDAGYQTAIAGKYFNKWDLTVPPPGFDTWAITTEGYESSTFAVDGQMVGDTGYSTSFIEQQALRMLRGFEEADDQPWFLYIAPFAPHFPYTPAPEDAASDVGHFRLDAAAEPDLSDKPPEIRARQGNSFLFTPEEAWTGQRRTLLSVDRMVAALFAAMDEAGEEDTLAVFVSDNGYLLGEHGIAQDKRLPYGESIEIPLLMRWPDELDAGSVDDRLVTTVDITATVLDAAGVHEPFDPPLDGRSLLDQERRDEVLVEQFAARESPRDLGVSAWAAVRSDELQYIEWYDSAGAVTWRELYDLRTDPGMLESTVPGDVSADDPRVRALTIRLADMRTCSGTAGARACP